MKQLLLLLLLVVSCSVLSQNQIIKLDTKTGSFKNFPVLPSYSTFYIEGEVLPEIVWVEVEINETKSKKSELYSWNRSFSDLSSNFEVIVTQGLQGSSKYDFNIRTFGLMETPEKTELFSTLIKKVHSYLTEQVYIDKNTLKLNSPNNVYSSLNEIIEQGTSLQRSRNGLTIAPLSDLIKDELKNINGLKLKRFFRKRSKDSEIELSAEAKQNKVDYITTLIISELKPFFNSDLVQQHRIYSIENVDTQKDKFTLPINAGIYTWTTSANFNKINASNSGVTPGLGLTIPVFRNYSIKGKKLPSMGISLGVLTNPVKDDTGAKFSTPGINIPVYAALGFNFLKVIRLNVGVIAVAPHKIAKVTSLNWYPTIGLAFELDAWVGIRK